MRDSPYMTQRALAAELGTDGSLVGKWLNGKVHEIKLEAHRERLVELLNTPAGYFDGPSRSDRLAKVGEEVSDLRESIQLLLEVSARLAGQVVELGGHVPQETLDALRRAVDGRPS